MRYVVSEENWQRKCRAVGAAGNTVPDTLTDKLIDKILRASLAERIEFPDRKVEGLYLRAGVDRSQKGGAVVPGSRPWMLRGRVRGTGERFHYKVGDARKGMSVEQARDRASVELGKLAAGLNPQAVAKADAAQRQTVGHFLETTYVPQKLAHCKTGDEIERNIRQVWAP